MANDRVYGITGFGAYIPRLRMERAADALSCSPSALSMQLSALEARIGQVLTERTGRGLRLSAEGERLLAAARDTVHAADRFAQLARAAPVDGQPAPAVPVVVGTILDPPAIRLGEFLRAVRERGPQLHPELRHGISGSVLREVQDGRVDLGFFLGQADGPGWRVQTLAPVRYVVVAPRGWQGRLEGRRWEELAALPWIDTPKESVHHALLQPVFGGRPRSTVARVERIISNRACVFMPPVGMTITPRAVSASCADQKPMYGPNENARTTRSSGPTSAASSTYCQQSIHHCQSSAVSTTIIGRPRVPLVW